MKAGALPCRPWLNGLGYLLLLVLYASYFDPIYVIVCHVIILYLFVVELLVQLN